MNDRDYCAQEAACQGDNGTEPAADPVEVVVASYLDYLEGITERPALDQLTTDDRRRAVAAINSMLTGRGIQLDGSTPSVEALRSSRFSPVYVHVWTRPCRRDRRRPGPGYMRPGVSAETSRAIAYRTSAVWAGRT